MALTLRKPSSSNNLPEASTQAITQKQENPDQISNPILRNIGRLGARALESVGGTILDVGQNNIRQDRMLQNFVRTRLQGGEALPEIPSGSELIRQGISEPLLGKEGSKPQGTFEEIADLTAGSLPFSLLLGGGSLLQNLGRDISSNTARKGAEKLGLKDPISQLLAGTLGASAFQKINQFTTSRGKPISKGLMEFGKEAEKETWERAEKLGQPIDKVLPKYADNLKKIEHEIHDNSALSEPERTDLLAKIDRYRNDLSGDFTSARKEVVNAKKLTDRVKEINSIYTKSKSSAYDQIIGRIKGQMKDAAKDIGQQYPTWFEQWNNANDLTKANNYKGYLTQATESNPRLLKIVNNPFAQAALGLYKFGTLGLVSPFIYAGAKAIGKPAIQKAEQIYGFYKYPGAQSVLKKAFEATVDRNWQELPKLYKQLNSLADRYEKKIEREEKPFENNVSLKGLTLRKPLENNDSLKGLTLRKPR